MYVTHEVMQWLKSQGLELERLRLGMAKFNNEIKSLKHVIYINLHGGHQEDQSFVSGSAVKEDQNLTISKDSKELGELLNHEDFKNRFFDIERRFSDVVEEIEKLSAYTHEQIGDIEGEVNNHESRLLPIEDKLQTLKAITRRWVFDSQTGISLVVDEIEKLRVYTDEQIGEIGGEVQNHESKFVPIEDELQILKAENELGKSRFFKVESMLAGAMEEMEKLKASTQQINEIESKVMHHKSQLDPIKVGLKMLYEASEMARNNYRKLDGEMEKLEAKMVELKRVLVRFGGAAIYKSNTNCSNDVRDQLNKIEDGVMNQKSNLVSIEDEVQVLKAEKEEVEKRLKILEMRYPKVLRCGKDKLLRRLLFLSLAFGTYCYHFV